MLVSSWSRVRDPRSLGRGFASGLYLGRIYIDQVHLHLNVYLLFTDITYIEHNVSICILKIIKRAQHDS